MKKFVIVLLLVVGFALCAFTFEGNNVVSNQEFLRIHIRANSNDIADQSVKYAVKKAVVDYLTPQLANATTKAQAMQVVASNALQIQQVANDVLMQNGFAYTSNVCLCSENFPTRSYDGVVLGAGVYDALIVNLGSGKGDNWWCVIYPPLCFVPSQTSQDDGKVVLRFKILEVIKNWKNSR